MSDNEAQIHEPKEDRAPQFSLPIVGEEATEVEARPAPAQWRSLEELAERDDFQELIQREFPEQASEWMDPISRRRFLTLMGASLAFAGLTGCGDRPRETILPYVKSPEGMVPGKPLFYATSVNHWGAATPLLVESREGRPIKIEGNSDHPSSPGTTDTFAQASILSLYDPDRSQAIRFRGTPSSWIAASRALTALWQEMKAKNGAGLRILTGTVTSPSLASQLNEITGTLTDAKWHQYEPVHRDEEIQGMRLAFGQVKEEGSDTPVTPTPIYHVDKANVIVSLDADFLASGPSHLVDVEQFMSRRRFRDHEPEIEKVNRLYVIEPTPSLTGGKADHRLPLSNAQLVSFAQLMAGQIASELKKANRGDDETIKLLEEVGQPQSALSTPIRKWMAATVRDLVQEKNEGKSLILAGRYQPALIHALAHVMNQALGNSGKTVSYSKAIEARPENQKNSLKELVKDIKGGKVEALLILGTNPAYDAPADVKFLDALDNKKIRFRMHLGLYEDETSRYCHWHVPQTHFLESWSDDRSYDGTITITQPLIDPLYENAKSAHEVLALLSDSPLRSSHDVVRAWHNNEWDKAKKTGDFDTHWKESLHNGYVADSKSSSVDLKLQPDEWKMPAGDASASTSEEKWEISFRPDPTIHDGRFANNGWLQELPKPLTKITWDNVVLISPNSAKKLKLDYQMRESSSENAPVLQIKISGRDPIEAPVWVMPGQADNTLTLFLGYGREQAGKVGTGLGYNAYKLQSVDHPWIETNAEVTVTGRSYTLACTQKHHVMEHRHLIQHGSVKELEEHPHEVVHKGHDPAHGHGDISLYPHRDYSNEYKWGMAIDLTACTGCSACVVACQSENNIPVVGKEEVRRGREMHWIRLDRYYEGEPENPETLFQPVNCMHCEQAPCEVVCPVNATVHSDEGLNDMVYNRCVGTRYCSNNCPYKVRRFNFLQYSDFDTEQFKLMRNPEVTVRSRGVMEKCTYCVQRISAARIETEKERIRSGRDELLIADGDLMTACQAACPANAILFGDLNQKNHKVTQAKASPLNYGLLEELNTVPRTTYLAAITNPNDDPDLKIKEA